MRTVTDLLDGPNSVYEVPSRFWWRPTPLHEAEVSCWLLDLRTDPAARIQTRKSLFPFRLNQYKAHSPTRPASNQTPIPLQSISSCAFPASCACLAPLSLKPAAQPPSSPAVVFPSLYRVSSSFSRISPQSGSRNTTPPSTIQMARHVVTDPHRVLIVYHTIILTT